MTVPPSLREMLPFVVGIQFVIGLLLWFMGYRIFRSVLGLYGFAVGAALGGGLALAMGGNQIIAVVAAIVAGLVCGVLAVWVYFVGVFLAGGAVGALGGIVLSGLLGGVPLLALLLACVLGIIGGIIALLLQKFIIILSTACTGAAAIVFGAAFFLTSGRAVQWFAHPLDMRGKLGLPALVWLVLTVAGILIQGFLTARKAQPHRPRLPRSSTRA